MRVFILLSFLLLSTACAQRLNEASSLDRQIEENDKISYEQSISNDKIENKALFQLAFGLIF